VRVFVFSGMRPHPNPLPKEEGDVLKLRPGTPIQAFDSKVDNLLGDGRDDKDFAVTHPSGAGDFDDLAQDFLDSAVVDPQRDFDLGQESQRVFAVGVLIEIALLPAVAFDLADAARLEGRPLEPFQHSLGQEGLDDGDDLFHGFTAIAVLCSRAKLAAARVVAATGPRVGSS
jgi:hypothetical protein